MPCPASLDAFAFRFALISFALHHQTPGRQEDKGREGGRGKGAPPYTRPAFQSPNHANGWQIETVCAFRSLSSPRRQCERHGFALSICITQHLQSRRGRSQVRSSITLIIHSVRRSDIHIPVFAIYLTLQSYTYRGLKCRE